MKAWWWGTIHCSFFSLHYLVLTHSELPTRTLSEILAPSSLMVGRKFELNVDEWKFVGHPFSAQTVSFTTACNVIFVLQVNVFEMYSFCGYINSYVHWLCINISQRLESATLKSCLLLPIACSFQSYCSPAVVAAYDHLSHLIGSAVTHEEQKWAASSM